MKKIYISYSFSKKDDFKKFHGELKNYLESRLGFEVYAFVFDFTDEVDDKTLMDKALEKINESDLIMVELSNKSVGVGIEAGYAKAKGKPIVYLHKSGTELKQTMNGISDVVISYENVSDLIAQISSHKLFQS